MVDSLSSQSRFVPLMERRSDRPLSASVSAPALPRSALPRAQTPDTRGSRAGSAISRAPARPRTAQASHSGTRGLGTKSTFGSQFLGGRSSAPSFSFGSAPARIALSGGSQRRAELQPSVAASSQRNPGPIYNPKGNTPMGDGPRHPFGTEVRASRTLVLSRLASGPPPPRLLHQTQRPPAMTNSEVSKTTGQSMSPGPGTYALQSAFGPQYLAVWKSSPIWPAGWPRLAEAPGSLRHGLALKGASREPAGRRLSNCVFDTGTSAAAATYRTTHSALRSSTRRLRATRATPGRCTTCHRRRHAVATSSAPPTRSAPAPKGGRPRGANASPAPATTGFRPRSGRRWRPSTSPEWSWALGCRAPRGRPGDLWRSKDSTRRTVKTRRHARRGHPPLRRPTRLPRVALWAREERPRRPGPKTGCGGALEPALPRAADAFAL